MRLIRPAEVAEPTSGIPREEACLHVPLGSRILYLAIANELCRPSYNSLLGWLQSVNGLRTDRRLVTTFYRLSPILCAQLARNLNECAESSYLLQLQCRRSQASTTIRVAAILIG